MSNLLKTPFYSVATLFSAIGLGLSIPLIVFSFPVKAQTNQSFSQCVLNLYRGPYTASDAAKNCLMAFRGRAVNEEFTTCVNALYGGPFSTSGSNQYCQQAFQNSVSSTPANNTNPTIIIVPQGQPEQKPSNQEVTIRPTSQSGNYWVYQKPSNLTEDQMRTAGAAYYSSPQACSMHYSLCTILGGVWLSTQQSLTIQLPQSAPVNLQPQPTSISPSSPKSDTELYLGFYRECIDRTMYKTLSAFDGATAANGYNMGYKYGRKPSNLSDAQMKSAGLNWDWTFQSWIGSQPQVKIPIMESVQASQQCKAELGNIRP